MTSSPADARLHAFSTAPFIEHTFNHVYPDYLSTLRQVAEWADQADFDGMLLLHNLDQFDPWQLAAIVLAGTGRLVPVIAAAPEMLGPVPTVRAIRSLVALYGRGVHLNGVTGAVGAELLAMAENLDHDERYERLAEHLRLTRLLLASEEPVTFDGSYYRARRLSVGPHVESAFRPLFFVAGASAAAVRVAARHADVWLTSPVPADQFGAVTERALAASSPAPGIAIRMGILARPSSAEAWAAAAARFPQSRLGRAKAVMKRSSHSAWARQIAEIAVDSMDTSPDEVYWMGAYTADRSSSCPYLVGSFEEVAAYLRTYLARGMRYLFLDGPFTGEDFDCAAHVIRLAQPRQDAVASS